VERIVLRLITGQLVLGAVHLIGRILDFRLVFLQLRLQLWNLQDRHYLVSLHVGSIVNQQFFYVSGFLRIDIDLLEGHQFGRQRDLPAKRLFHHLGHADRHRRSARLHALVVTTGARS